MINIQNILRIIPIIDESDFRAQVFKDVATITALSPQGTPVNPDKFHYTVTETDLKIEYLIMTTSIPCAGFDGAYELDIFKYTQDIYVDFVICVNYVGDCEGTLHPGEVRHVQ